MPKKKDKKEESIESKDTDIDFSFEDVEKEVDKILGTSDKDETKKPKLHHITEKIQTGMEIKHNPPDKGFLDVKVNRVKVKYTDRYGQEQETDKILVRSKDIENVEHFEIGPGLFAMDFRNDCNFWFNRSPSTVPGMINQAVRVAIDIKECYKIKKRKLELPIVLILALLGGAVIIILMLILLMS